MCGHVLHSPVLQNCQRGIGWTKRYINIVAIKSWIDIDEIGFYHNCEKVFIENIYHRKDELAQFGSIQEQLSYRKLLVENRCACNGVNLQEVDAFVGRGGGFSPQQAVYIV